MQAESELKSCPFCGNDNLCFDGETNAANYIEQPHVGVRVILYPMNKYWLRFRYSWRYGDLIV